MNIRFVKTRHTYDSYGDFWELVRLSGYEECFVDEVDVSQPFIYIITPVNGEIEHVKNEVHSNKTRRAVLIWWNLERWDATGETSLDTRVRQALDEIGFDVAWVSDRYYASLHPRLTHAVMGGNHGLRHVRSEPTVYDVAHISYAWGRRESLYRSMSRAGIAIAPGAWGAARDAVLASSRMILSLHQYPGKIIAPMRFALAAAYNLPLISEEAIDPYPHRVGIDFVSSPYEGIEGAVAKYLSPEMDEERKRLARELTMTLCEKWTFRAGVADAINRLGLDAS